jgi:MFS family permease
MSALTVTAPAGEADERPTDSLPIGQLVRLSLYWLGLSSIFAGLSAILGGRLEFERLVPAGTEGSALFQMTVFGAVIAAIVQPTVGSLSDYTVSRWGRRKPYIVVGSVLDIAFLVGIATSSTVVTIAAFVALLQVSANMAQGPFQGYVPDLVPARQVGLASALVGLFQILGNVTGFAVGALAVASGQYAVATVALGGIEVVTMLSVAVGVREGRPAKSRGGRSWARVARDAWGADVLRERSFIWLVGSRLFVLIGSGMLVNLAVFYLVRSLGLAEKSDAGQVYLAVAGLVAIMVLLTVVPAARASDRLGRKPVIYAACTVGACALAIVALAPSVPVALVGAALLGISTGSFLAVDWALMTDIIPKASSGRYMGTSNVATASSGVLATALGGRLMDVVGGLERLGSGPRAAMWLAVRCYVVGAILLHPVREPPRRAAGTGDGRIGGPRRSGVPSVIG